MAIFAFAAVAVVLALVVAAAVVVGKIVGKTLSTDCSETRQVSLLSFCRIIIGQIDI